MQPLEFGFFEVRTFCPVAALRQKRAGREVGLCLAVLSFGSWA